MVQSMKYVSQIALDTVHDIQDISNQTVEVLRNAVLYEGGDKLLDNHLRLLQHQGLSIHQRMLLDTMLPSFDENATVQSAFRYLETTKNHLAFFMEGVEDGKYIKIVKAHEAPHRDYCYVGESKYRATTVFVNSVKVTPGYRAYELNHETLHAIFDMSRVILYWLKTQDALRDVLSFLYTVLEDTTSSSNSDSYRVLSAATVLHSHILEGVHRLSTDPQYAHLQNESIPWVWRAPMVAQEVSALLRSNGDALRAHYHDFIEYYYPKVEKKKPPQEMMA